MRIAEVISRSQVVHGHEPPRVHRHAPPRPVQPVDADIREAARTLVANLRSLRDAHFTVYSRDLKPLMIGTIHDGKVLPADLEQRLLQPTANGFSIDVSIGEPPRRWLSVVYPAGAGPARRVIRWPSAPKLHPGKSWLWGLAPDRVRRTSLTVGDLITATGGDR